MLSIFELPVRIQKPRESGITMALDKGLSTNQIREWVAVSGDYFDYVKLGWATSVVTPNLQEKIDTYHELGIPICLGGTLLELTILQNKLAELAALAKDFGIEMLEVSDGSITLDRGKKLKIVEDLAKEFIVLSEYGSKDAEFIFAPSQWVQGMQEELDAGAWKVIAEGRESGKAGLYRESTELRTGLVDDIALAIPQENVIWEAPLKSQQAWFITKFGSNVNLGNIAPEEVLSLETLRLGLRSDTLCHFHDKSTSL